MQRLILAFGLIILALVSACDRGSSPAQSGSTASGGGGSTGGGGSGGTPTTTYASAEIPVLILDSELPAAVTGQSYSHQMTAIGGTGTYTWSITYQSASGYVSISSSGVLTVTQMWSSIQFDLGIRAEDSAGEADIRYFQMYFDPPPPPPGFVTPSMTYVINAGEEMSKIDTGWTLSRFQRAMRSAMRDIASLIWGLYQTRYTSFVVIHCGQGTVVTAGAYTAEVTDKAAAINAIAQWTPGGEAPMYSAMSAAQTFQLDGIFLYSGGAFGIDPLAPGGQADYANVLSLVGPWISAAPLSVPVAFDYLPSGAHAQFMTDFAALTTYGNYQPQ